MSKDIDDIENDLRDIVEVYYSKDPSAASKDILVTVMKEIRGRANPALVIKIIREFKIE